MEWKREMRVGEREERECEEGDERGGRGEKKEE